MDLTSLCILLGIVAAIVVLYLWLKAPGSPPAKPFNIKAGGPIVASCAHCNRQWRGNWLFCPYCCKPPTSAGVCKHCNHPLPDEAGIKFCPYCALPVS